MYKDGYLSYNETATNEAISDASHAGGYCNDIQTCISNIKSNAKYSVISNSSVLTNINKDINKVSEISKILSEQKDTIEAYCRTESMDTSLLNAGYIVVKDEQFGRQGYLYLPPGYTSTKGLPMLVYLNCDGRREDMSNLNNHGIGSLLNKGYQMDAVVYVPVFTEAQGASTSRLHSAINNIAQTYKVDSDRISLMGYSAGGWTAVDLAGQHPGYYSTIVTCGAGPTAANGKALAESGTKLIAFIGTQDPFYNKAIGSFDAMVKNGGSATLYRVNGGSHDGSNYNGAFSVDVLYDLLHIKKGEIVEMSNSIQDVDLTTMRNTGLLNGDNNSSSFYQRVKKPGDKEVISLEIEENETNSNKTPISPSGMVDNALNIPYYNQGDPRWGDIVYTNRGSQLKNSACGFTSLAMITAGLSGDGSVNPYTVIQDIRHLNAGEKSNLCGAAYRTELTDRNYLAKYNIVATELTDKNTGNVMNELNQGHPIIMEVPGHYITLTLSNSGKILVLDPYSNWARSTNKGTQEFETVKDLVNTYGYIYWAASYEATNGLPTDIKYTQEATSKPNVEVPSSSTKPSTSTPSATPAPSKPSADTSSATPAPTPSKPSIDTPSVTPTPSPDTTPSVEPINNIIPDNKFKEFIPKLSDGNLGAMEISDKHVDYEILNIKEDTYDKYIDSLKTDGYTLGEDGLWTKDNHTITVIRSADNSSLNITLKENTTDNSI